MNNIEINISDIIIVFCKEKGIKVNILNINHFNYFPKNYKIIGKIDVLYIIGYCENLNLFNLECEKIIFVNEELTGEYYLSYSMNKLNGKSLINYILPNSLKILNCIGNGLTSLPKLPNSLKILFCSFNKIVSLPDRLPNSLKELHCDYNKLTKLPNLPNSLQELYCDKNQLTKLPNLPNSLKILHCNNNQLISFPETSNLKYYITLKFNQSKPIEYFPYSDKINKSYINFFIKDYFNNPINNQTKLNEYMEYVINYKMNRIKSARN